MRIYIAGPITGISDFRDRFARAQRKVEELGQTAVNPALDGIGRGKPWSWYMRRATMALLTCDAVLLLDGWQDSRGASREHQIAVELEMPIATDIRGIERLVADGWTPPHGDAFQIEVEWGARGQVTTVTWEEFR